MPLDVLERRECATAGPQLAPVLRRDVRFGAAVYGTFLAASVIGVAYESGASARTMTLSLLGSMLVFSAAHVWSEVVGERIWRGDALGPRHVLLIGRRESPLVDAAALPVHLPRARVGWRARRPPARRGAGCPLSGVEPSREQGR